MTPLTNSRWALVFVTVLLCAAFVPPAGATGQPVAPDSSRTSSQSSVAGESVALYQQQNNTTVVQHEDPDSTNEDGNLNAVESRLAQQLAERLAQSNTQLSEGDYNRARELLGDEYSATLEKYADVAGDTGTEETLDQFRNVQETQREYTESVSEYQQTRNAYREAKQNGNEARARRLARELNRLERESTQSAQQLNDSYTSLSNQTGADVTESQEQISRTQENVSTQTSEIVTEEFTPTEVTVELNRTQLSFREPVQVNGTLVTENGSTLSPRSVNLTVGGQNVTTSLSEDGQFSVAYRPTLLPVSSRNLTVRYVPSSTSVYLGSNTTTNVSVTQTNASLRLTQAPESVTYGENLTISGHLSVDDTPVRAMPVRLSLGATPIGTVTTNESGEFRFQAPFPSNVSTGTQELQVEMAVTNRSVTASSVSQPVAVEQTPTSLTLTVDEQSGTVVAVSGEFETADGESIANETVKFVLNGTLVGTASTGPDGMYQTQFQLPEGVLSDIEAVQLTAVYTGGGTNLATTRATTTIETSGGELVPSNSRLWIVGGVVTLVALLGGGFVYYRRLLGAESPEPTVDDGEVASVSDTTPERGQSLLNLAHDRLARDEASAAIGAAYEALRQRFSPELELPSSATHWEFYRAYQAQIGTQESQLQDLIETYEEATYSPSKPSESEADEVLDITAGFIDPPSGSASDD